VREAQPVSEGGNSGAPRPATERAEEMLDAFGQRVGLYMAALAPRIRRLAALAREEAEDIWAEAQHLRNQARGRSE
jgi:hypothetical protein